MKTTNCLYTHIDMLQEFTVDSKVIVTSHLEIVRKSHTWHIGSLRILRRVALMTDELDIP